MKIYLKIACCLSGFPLAVCGANLPKQPNIILINIDDLGWADLSYQGSAYYQTPNIDKLKKTGVYFSQAYACASNSMPSRASLMTGQYTPRHGIYTVNPVERGDVRDRKFIPHPNPTALDPQILTLPQMLKNAGYQTCHIGKWHISGNPRLHGMDINIGGNSSGNPSSYFAPYNLPELHEAPQGEYLPYRLAKEAVRYLTEVDKRLVGPKQSLEVEKRRNRHPTSTSYRPYSTLRGLKNPKHTFWTGSACFLF